MNAPTIAVINDDPSIIGFLHDLLTEEGYEVPVAMQAAEAHPLIAERLPDAVVLDIRMETPDAGLRVLEQLRIDPRTRAIPVIVCTADARFLREKAERLQALHCTILEKPFLIEELLDQIAAIIGPPKEMART